MTTHTKKQFGVWMDTHHATVVAKADSQGDTFVVLAQVERPDDEKNSNENAANHQKSAAAHKFFKEIAAHMPNVDELHVTGTGQVQEQFIHFLAETPQYRKAKTGHSTSNRMADAQLTEFIAKQFR